MRGHSIDVRLRIVGTITLLTTAMLAQSPRPELVKDINTIVSAPRLGSSPHPARTFPGGVFDPSFLKKTPRVFFAAYTTRNGVEPFMSSGTASTTVMLADIHPRHGSSNPREFTLSRDLSKVFFTADDGTHGAELWVCDLTSAPPLCTLVKDIAPGPAPSQPQNFAAFGTSGIVFSANTAGIGYELWTSDGTANGTKLVKDIWPGPLHSSPSAMRANVKGDRVFFYAMDDQHGLEPWVTDGTPAGTAILKDIVPGAGSSAIERWQDIGDSNATKMIFAAYTPITGSELWITDGSAANTKMIKDIWPGTFSGAGMFHSLVVSGTLYFRGDDGKTGLEIWKTDGTANGTQLVYDTDPSGSGGFMEPTASGGKIYFVASHPRYGAELWVHDPTATTNATRLVADVYPGPTGSTPNQLAATLNGRVFFNATSLAAGDELYVTDGTAAGTRLVKDIFPGTDSGYARHMTETLPGRVAFTADDGLHGNELWISDGTSAGTVRVPLETNPLPMTDSALVNHLAEMNGKLYFSASDGATGLELWSSDGTAAGTRQVIDLYPGALSGLALYNTRLGNRIFFAGNTPATGTELFSSDGTAAGTSLVKDLYPGSIESQPRDLQRIGDKIYFSADAGQGFEPFVTDGTAAGTMQLADLEPGRGSSYGYFGRARLPNGLVVQGYTFSQATGFEMAVTDGTPAGTKIVDLVPGSRSSYPRYMTAMAGKIYFSADLGSGYELCVTDGTAAGTSMVVDLVPGSGSSYWYDLTSDGSLLYGYVVVPSQGGAELWASDGTAAGTKRLADINPGPSDSNARYHVAVGSRHVYFQANDGWRGAELFRWNGSRLDSWDIAPGLAGSAPRNVSDPGYHVEVVNGYVYLRAEDGIVGTELFRMFNGATATDRYPGCSDLVLSGTDPVMATTARVDVSNPRTNPMTALVLGRISQTPFVLPGSCPWFVDAREMIVVGVSSQANATFSIPIPNSTALEGGNVVFQAIDIGRLPKLETSNPLQWTLSSR